MSRNSQSVSLFLLIATAISPLFYGSIGTAADLQEFVHEAGNFRVLLPGEGE